MEGWDRSPTAIAYAESQVSSATQASHKANNSTLHFHVHDALELPCDESFDVVMCTLFMHHLDRADALRLMQSMYRTASSLVLIDDLRRTQFGYWLAQVGCQLLTRSHIVHVDGPLSVRAAFTEEEIRQLSLEGGLPEPQFKRHWPQRFLMSWTKARRD